MIKGDDLPEGWVLAKLEDLCTPPQYGWTTSADKDRAGLKLFRTTDISGGRIDWSSVPGCAQEPDDFQKYLLAPGDILISRAGSVGVSYLVNKCPSAIFASYLIRFRPKPPLESKFIALFLKSPEYWATIVDETAGIAVPNVNASKLRKIVVRLPPLAEQTRIVARVEQLLARVNATKERLAKVVVILKRFRQAVLAAACSGRLTADWRSKHPGVRATPNEYGSELPLEKRSQKFSTSLIDTGLPNLPETWFWAPLGQCVSICRGRFSIRPRNNPRYYGGQNPFVQIGDLPPAGGDIKTFKQTLNKEGLAVSSLFPAGTLLIAIVGATIGNTGILNFRSCCPDSLVAIKAKAKEQSRFIEYYLRWKKLEIREESYASGGQPNINLQTLIPYPIPVAPQMEIEEIVRRIEVLFKHADSIERHVTMATLRAENLTRAILSKAFCSGLVLREAELARREGRSYEPASALLARIKAERAEKGTNLKPVGRSALKNRPKKDLTKSIN